jgi:hypothetical protein
MTPPPKKSPKGAVNKDNAIGLPKGALTRPCPGAFLAGLREIAPSSILVVRFPNSDFRYPLLKGGGGDEISLVSADDGSWQNTNCS